MKIDLVPRNNNINLQILNLALRVLTLFSKFALIIALAKLFPPELIGFYGLFAATITYSIYLIGFDFNTYSTRHIIRA